MTLSPEQFRVVAEFLHGNAGIELGVNRSEIAAARIENRMKEIGVESIDAYLDQLQWKNDAEAAHFIESMLIGETYFYRESAHFNALEKIVAPELSRLRDRGERSVRAWSAGCSIGCEPYTIAMVLQESLPGWKVEVVATDLHRQALEHLRRGIYHERLMRYVPERYLAGEKYFLRQNDHFQTTDLLRSMVSSRVLNLSRDDFPGEFDVIFCRNVLIYFNRQTSERVIKKFYTALRRGGYFFAGATDSLQEHTAFFDATNCPDGVIYGKWSTDRRLGVTARAGSVGTTVVNRRCPTPPSFNASFETRDGCPVIRLCGVIDDHGDGKLRTILTDLLPPAADRLIWDFEKVPYMTNSALFTLKRLFDEHGERIKDHRFENVNSRMVIWFEKLKLAHRIVNKSQHDRSREFAVADPPPRRRSHDGHVSAAPHGRSLNSPDMPPLKAVRTPDVIPYLIQERESQGISVLEFSGVMDADLSPDLMRIVTEKLQRLIHLQRPRIILNLTNVNYVDQEIIPTVIRALRVVRERSGDIKVCATGNAIARFLERSGETVDLYSNMSDAITCFQKEAELA